MEQYIKKSDIIAEIDRELESISNASTNFALGRKMELAKILSFINTLEVKEMNLEKEANEAWDYIFSHGWDENSRMALKHDEYMAFAQHFFELGIKAKGE